MRRTVILGIAGISILTAAVLVARATRSRLAPAPSFVDDTPTLAHTSPVQHDDELATPDMPAVAGLDLLHTTLADGAMLAPADGGSARLTLDPDLQRTATGLLGAHHLPEAAIVLMDVATGRLLVYASHVEKGPRARPVRRGERPVGERLQGRDGRGPRRGRAPRARHQAVLLGRRAAHQHRRPRRRPAARPVVHDARRRDGPQHQHGLRAPGPQEPGAAAARGHGAALRLRLGAGVRRARAAERAAHPDGAARVRAHGGRLLEHDALAARGPADQRDRRPRRRGDPAEHRRPHRLEHGLRGLDGSRRRRPRGGS